MPSKKTVPLGDVIRVIGGGTPSKNDSTLWGGDIPWASVRDLKERYLSFTEFSITEKGLKSCSTNVIPKGFVVIASRVGLGKVVQLNVDAAINQDLRGLIPFDPESISSDFVYYWAKSVANQIVEAGSGATVQGVRLDFLKSLRFPILSRDEQDLVVQRMDSVFESISDLSDVFARELSTISQLTEEFRNQLLAEKTRDLEAVAFGSVGQFVRGPFGGSLKKSSFTTSGHAVYEQQHAIHDQTSEFRYFINDSKFKEMERFSVKPDDLLMSCSGTFGKMTIVAPDSPKGIINQALLKISLQEGVLSEFMKQWMQSIHFQDVLQDSVGGAALQNVPAVSEMKKFPVKVPSVPVQKEIIRDLSVFAERVEQLKLLVEKKALTLNELRNSFLTEAFQR